MTTTVRTAAHAAAPDAPSPRERWPARVGIVLVAALALLASAVVRWAVQPSGDEPDAAAMPASALVAPPPTVGDDPRGHANGHRDAEVKRRFDEAIVMLHARQYEHAAAALHRLLELAPTMPEAHVNMGYALLGLGRHAAARDFFVGATELAPAQANAYYGMAVSLEALGDLPGAIGAMRTYLHLARDERESHLRRARAALWEWESRPR